MSDTEDGADAPPDRGDDDFDKEAEREKLREQYEADQKRREATQQMSELLLKGATMTDHHCDDCGSPIFRYDGEAFCPTCAGTRGVEGEEGGDQAGQGGQRQGGQQQGQSAAGGQQQGQSAAGAQQGGQGRTSQQQGQSTAGGQQQGGRSTQRGGQQRPDGQPGGSTGGDPRLSSDAPGDGGQDRSTPPGDQGELDEDDLDAARRRLDERAGTSSAEVGGPGNRRPDAPVGDSPVRQGEVPSMAQTRASLRRAIVSLSEQAAQSDDPNRAHDLLKGAREASEALAALEGTTGE